MGSVASSFQMISYKIDKISLSTNETIGVIQERVFSTEKWSFAIGIRHPMHDPENRVYIGGLDALILYGNKDNPEVTLKAGIGGLFKVVGDDFSPQVEERVAKIQIPAILASYLRAAVTNILASAGFGSVLLPLLNMNAIAEEQLKDVNIQRIGENNEEENSNKQN